MKGIDLFCASPASTAICVSMDQRSMVRHGSRAIDRHNPHLLDGRRSRALTPSSSQPPMKPKPYHQKTRKSSAKATDVTRKSSAKQTDLTSPPGSSRYLLSDTTFFDVSSDFDPVLALVPNPIEPARTLSVYPDESPALKLSSSTRSRDQIYLKSLSVYPDESPRLKPSSSTISHDQVFSKRLAIYPDESPALKRSSDQVFSKPLSIYPDESPALKPSSSTRSRDQVVVLRVSLHCKGCEGKVRKHISRMQGVTSFTIDFATKKVTIIGDVTPLGVLASVSRVKNAQFWPSSSPSSSSSP
ncbi:hypothetical protein HHK36_016477 [Tetracentron sinense]|uniref:HMA domain-containing protein n=1 Tax=Tetracentron sinense TaxID=13715 RepID=A0A835DBJ0_TETSI|nr:hypothetical protein HHK36_016477 [Tetracentron sinense]